MPAGPREGDRMETKANFVMIGAAIRPTTHKPHRTRRSKQWTTMHLRVFSQGVVCQAVTF